MKLIFLYWNLKDNPPPSIFSASRTAKLPPEDVHERGQPPLPHDQERRLRVFGGEEVRGEGKYPWAAGLHLYMPQKSDLVSHFLLSCSSSQNITLQQNHHVMKVTLIARSIIFKIQTR